MSFLRKDLNDAENKEIIKNQVRLLLKFHSISEKSLKTSYLVRGYSEILVDQAIAEVLAEPGVRVGKEK